MITDGFKILIKNETLNKYIFILSDNKPDIPAPNTWEITGGGIEPGETPTEALKREIKEELGIRVKKNIQKK